MTWWNKEISSSSFPVESGMGFQEIVKQQILSNSQLYSDTMLFFENVSDAKSSDF